MRFIDGDSHFIEPLDLFTRYIEAPYRERAVRMEVDPSTDQPRLLVDGRPMRLVDVDELLGAVVGYGQKEAGRKLGDFPSLLAQSQQWQDMDERIRFLDREGFAAQVLYPTMGLLWEGSVEDPALAAAHCRAYNTWAFELCADHKDRLYPAAHISLRDSALAVDELERIAKLGARTIFIGAAPVGGRSFGHPAYDPIWAAAQSLDLSIGIHLVGHANYTGSQWYRDGNPGFMYVTMNVIQDPRQALTTMVYDGVFERFPKLRVATIEAMAGWIGEWVERLDYRYRYMGHTSRMKRPASEYFERNIWISADPVERTLPCMIELLGDRKFFIGSDYPHAEGFVRPIETARAALGRVAGAAIDRILGENAAHFFGI